MSEVRDDQLGEDTNPDDIGDILADIETASPPSPEGGDISLGASSSTASGSSTDAAKLAEELAQEKDKNLRLYAEFDNFRRRSAKESFELMATANAKLIGKLT